MQQVPPEARDGDCVRASAPPIDRAAILTTIWDRQALRREARLPLLDIKAEYERAVEQALWSAHVRKHYAALKKEVLAELQARHGPQFGGSVGGWWAVRLLAAQRLQKMFELDR